MALTALSIRNFRAFSRERTFRFAPITLLVGPNNSGKSSVTRALQLLQATAARGDWSTLALDDPAHRLGSHERVFNRRSGEHQIAFELEGRTDEDEGAVRLRIAYGADGWSALEWDFAAGPTLRLERDAWTEQVSHNDGESLQDRVRITARLDVDDYVARGACAADLGLDDRPDLVAWLGEALEAMPPLELEDDHRLLRSLLPEVWDDLLAAAAVQMATHPSDDPELRAEVARRWSERLTTGKTGAFYRRGLTAPTDLLLPPLLERIGAETPARILYLDDDPSLIATLLRDYHEDVRTDVPGHGPVVSDEVSQWLQAFGIGDRLETERVLGAGTAAYVLRKEWIAPAPRANVRLRPPGSLPPEAPASTPVPADRLPLQGRLPLADLGYGYTRLVPLILHVALKGRWADDVAPSLVVLEEPEANLHPSLQSKLGDLFAAMARRGQHVLAETHSEYLVRRLQYLVAKGDLPPEAVVIHYLTDDPTADDHVREITLDRSGFLSEPFGPGFFDEASTLMVEHFRFQSRN